MFNRLFLIFVSFVAAPLCLSVLSVKLGGHETITTKLTWSKEVSRVVYRRCASCHRPGGKAFSLLSYEEARPWAAAIQEEVLNRRMPPWNAVKGFGDFHPDRGLSQEEIHVISDWVEGGAPEGEAGLLPEVPRASEIVDPPAGGRRLSLRAAYRLPQARRLLAIRPLRLAPGTSVKVVAESPDGVRIPLLWLHQFDERAEQDYELAEPIRLPAGTYLRIYPPLAAPASFSFLLQ